VKDFDGGRNLIMATRKGILKKTPLSAYSNPRSGGIIGIKIDPGDNLIDVKLTSGHDEVVLVTRNGQSIRIQETDVRPMGRATRGVKGIRLGKAGDAVMGMEIVEERASLLLLCEHGYGKRTLFGEFRAQKRGGMGVIAIKTSKRNGPVVGVLSVAEGDDIIVMTADGKMMRTPVSQVRTISRNTIGVRIISLAEGDRVVDAAKSIAEDSEAEEGQNAQPEAPPAAEKKS